MSPPGPRGPGAGLRRPALRGWRRLGPPGRGAGPGARGGRSQARAVRPPPSPGAAARSCAGLGADAAAGWPRSSLVTGLRGTCSLLRSLSPPPLRSPPPASRLPLAPARQGWTRSRHSAPGATSRPAPARPGLRPAARQPRGHRPAGGGAPPASPGPAAGGGGHPPTPPPGPPAAPPGGGGPGRSDVIGAKYLRGETHSFDADLWGAGDPRVNGTGAVPGRGGGAGRGITAPQDVTCLLGDTYRGVGGR